MRFIGGSDDICLFWGGDAPSVATLDDADCWELVRGSMFCSYKCDSIVFNHRMVRKFFGEEGLRYLVKISQEKI